MEKWEIDISHLPPGVYFEFTGIRWNWRAWWVHGHRKLYCVEIQGGIFYGVNRFIEVFDKSGNSSLLAPDYSITYKKVK